MYAGVPTVAWVRVTSRGLREIAGETEVGELDRSVGVEQQVGGLDVAVQDLLGVQRRERFEHLAGGLDDLGDRQWPALQTVGEAAAGHPLHDDGEAVAGLEELEDPDQAGCWRVRPSLTSRRSRSRAAGARSARKTLTATGSPSSRSSASQTSAWPPSPSRRTRAQRSGSLGMVPSERGTVPPQVWVAGCPESDAGSVIGRKYRRARSVAGAKVWPKGLLRFLGRPVSER